MQNTILADKCSSGWFAAPLVKNIGVFLICPKDIVLLNFPQVSTSPSSGGIIGGGLLLLKVIISVGLFQMLWQNPQDNFNAIFLSNEIRNGGRIGGTLIPLHISKMCTSFGGFGSNAYLLFATETRVGADSAGIRDGRPAPRGTLPAGRGGFPAPTRPVKMIKTAGKLRGKIKAYI